MGSAGEVVQEYVAAQVERLLARGPGARVRGRRRRARRPCRHPAAARGAVRVPAGPGPRGHRSRCATTLAELGHVLGDARDAHVERHALRAGSRTRTRRSSSGPSSSGSTRTAPPRASAAQDRLDAWLASARFDRAHRHARPDLPAGPAPRGRPPASCPAVPVARGTASTARWRPRRRRPSGRSATRRCTRCARPRAARGTPARSPWRPSVRPGPTQRRASSSGAGGARRPARRRGPAGDAAAARPPGRSGRGEHLHVRPAARAGAARPARPAQDAAARAVRRVTRRGHRRWMS